MTALSCKLLFVVSLFALPAMVAAADKPVPSKPGKTRDASVAMAEFREAIAAIRTLGIKLSAEAKGKPAAGMRVMKVTTAKLAAVKTDGLPDDLRTAYDRMARFWKATEEFYAGMPDDDAAVEAWAKKKFSGPKFEEKFKPLMEEGRIAGAALLPIASKYEIEIELPGK